jgi:hypothetical protein
MALQAEKGVLFSLQGRFSGSKIVLNYYLSMIYFGPTPNLTPNFYSVSSPQLLNISL